MTDMLHGCLPDTDHLEVTSSDGRRYGVWVTVPPGYAQGTEPLPLVYVTDGNFAVGLTAPLIVTQQDPYLSVAPYIQVSVGYAGDEAAQWATLRNRDLVPPGEPVATEMVATLEAARDAGSMTQEHVDAYLAQLRDTHADAFLAFLVDDLHPLLQGRYRVANSGHGLFGYSYGGLFSLYAYLVGATTFATVGAGSPGVVSSESTVFDLVDRLPDGEPGETRLHVTLNERELLGHVPIYRDLARHALEVVEQLHAKGRSGVVTTAMLDQTHVTGVQASFLSYLTTSRAR